MSIEGMGWIKNGDLTTKLFSHWGILSFRWILRPLPKSSEGLAFVGGQAMVLIDGDRGKDKSKASCQAPGAYLMLPGY